MKTGELADYAKSGVTVAIYTFLFNASNGGAVGNGSHKLLRQEKNVENCCIDTQIIISVWKTKGLH